MSSSFSAAARTRSRTSSGPGLGIGRSVAISTFSNGPCSRMIAAFIVPHPFQRAPPRAYSPELSPGTSNPRSHRNIRFIHPRMAVFTRLPRSGAGGSSSDTPITELAALDRVAQGGNAPLELHGKGNGVRLRAVQVNLGAIVSD